MNIEKIKEQIYISYLRRVLTYACATWATTRGDEEKHLRFEKKILRKIHEPIYILEEQKWEIRSNNQLNAFYKKANVMHFVWSTKLKWMRRVLRAGGRLMNRIIKEEMGGTRLRERPRRRWMDSIWETMIELTQSREIDWDISKERTNRNN